MKSSRSLSLRALSSSSPKDRGGSTKPLFHEPDLDFEKELMKAVDKYNCSNIVVNKGVQNDEFYKNLKSQEPQKKVMLSRRTSTTAVSTAEAVHDEFKRPDDITGSTSTTFFNDDSALLVVDALYDKQNELVEIMISGAKDIPRQVIQCMGLFYPFFKYLTKLSITKSCLNVYTLHELSKSLPMSYLTDVYLDESFLCEANYAVLLNEKTKLRNLSLSKCRINDEVCALIASKLVLTAPTAKSLALLNLSSNHITDKGVESLAQALRTNRCLRYLNLADNRITDIGALQLFNVLAEFPLTNDEISQKRLRHMNYLRQKRAIYMDYFDDDTRSFDEYNRKAVVAKRSKASVASSRKIRKSTGDVDAATRAELMSLELLGPYVDPYSPDCTKIKDGWSYCLGNVALAYLNLAYNSLSYLVLKRLKAVLQYQSDLQIPNSGLMKVMLDGNPFPICREIDIISQLLMANVLRAVPEGKRKQSVVGKPLKK